MKHLIEKGNRCKTYCSEVEPKLASLKALMLFTGKTMANCAGGHCPVSFRCCVCGHDSPSANQRGK